MKSSPLWSSQNMYCSIQFVQNLSPINKSYTYPHQSNKSISNKFYTYPQINTNALNFLLNKKKWQIPIYAKYLYQAVARENGASRKFSTIPRPPRVARCSREPLPQCSTPPNKMIPYQTSDNPQATWKDALNPIAEVANHKSKEFTLLKILECSQCSCQNTCCPFFLFPFVKMYPS